MPQFYDHPFIETRSVLEEIEIKQKELDVAVDRWEVLEEMQSKMQVSENGPVDTSH